MRILFTAVAALAGVLGAAPIPAHALLVHIGSAYGEPIDMAPTVVELLGQRTNLDCSSAPVTGWAGNVLTVTVKRYADYAVSGGCSGAVVVDAGVLRAGHYRLVAFELDASTGAENERQVRDFAVAPMDGPGRCALQPELVPQLWVVHRTLAPEAFVAKLAADPAYAASLGHPQARLSSPGSGVWLSYPPLDDPTARHWRLAQTGEFAQIGKNGYVYGVPPGDGTGTFVEFYNARLDHYFYTADAPEILAIEGGLVGPDWSRTGETFLSYTRLGYVYGRAQQVAYRFTGKPDVGPSTHVFTVNREECHQLAGNGLWVYEGVALSATPLAAEGTCNVPGEVSLYRVWKPFGVSNHRFTTRPEVVAGTVARGWLAEGPAMCVLAAPAR